MMIGSCRPGGTSWPHVVDPEFSRENPRGFGGATSASAPHPHGAAMEAKASTGGARTAAPRVVIDRKLRIRVAGFAGKRRRANAADDSRSRRRVTAAASSDDRSSADDAMTRIEALLAASEKSATDKRVASQTLSGLLAQTQSALRDKVRYPRLSPRCPGTFWPITLEHAKCR